MSELPERITVRRATVADAGTLTVAAARMFIETFLAANDPSHVASYVAGAYSVVRQTAELRDPNTRTLLAELDGETIGYAQLRLGARSEHVTGPNPVELTRFYVDRTWHGRGLANILMRSVERSAAELGASTLWLGVWEHNPRAIAYYSKRGFLDVGDQEFWMGPDRQSDRVMMRPL